jgi:4-hydroxybenzoate polyprenyltransferase
MPNITMKVDKNDDEMKIRTIISRRVSRFTLKGIFLITMAVGIISSSMMDEGLR